MTAEAAMAIARLVAAISPYPWPADGSKHEAWVAVLAAPTSSDIRDDVAVATATRMLGEYSTDKLTPAQILATCRASPVIPKRYLEIGGPPEDSSGRAERPIYFPRDNGKEPFPVAHPDEAERERMRRFYAERAAHPRLLAARRDLGITPAHLEAAEEKREDEERRHEEHVAELEAQAELSAEDRAALKRAQARLEQLRAQAAPKPAPLRGALEGTLSRLGEQMGLACCRCGVVLEGEEMRDYVRRCMEAGRMGDVETPARYCAACAGWRGETQEAGCPPF